MVVSALAILRIASIGAGGQWVGRQRRGKAAIQTQIRNSAAEEV